MTGASAFNVFSNSGNVLVWDVMDDDVTVDCPGTGLQSLSTEEWTAVVIPPHHSYICRIHAHRTKCKEDCYVYINPSTCNKPLLLQEFVKEVKHHVAAHMADKAEAYYGGMMIGRMHTGDLSFEDCDECYKPITVLTG